jgi:predicted component of type VI protein secretion system
MKLSLVVAQGVHSGKVIPVTASEFVIGRDPQCQLRPASPAVSKQHCAISIRDGKVFIRDCGSTNGTFINDEQVTAEREVKAGDRVRVGPLEFNIRMDADVPGAKSSAVVAASAAKPAPAAKVAAASTDTVPGGANVMMAPPTSRSGSTATTVVEGAGSGLEEDPDHLAALLLGLDDGATSATVEQLSSDPTTVMETPALGAKPGEAKKPDPKKENADSSSAAADILSKYMRRPRT